MSRGRDHIAIKIKSSAKIDRIEVEKLQALAQNLPGTPKLFYVSQDPSRQKIGSVQCVPWRELFRKITQWGPGAPERCHRKRLPIVRKE